MIDKELEELFKIPVERCAFIGKIYHSTLYAYQKDNEKNFNQKEWGDKTRDLFNNYWLKYHSDDPNEVRQMLSEVSGVPVNKLPKELIYNRFIPTIKDLQKTSQYHSRAVVDEPNYKYYYDVVFDPYYHKIRNALLCIDPLFTHISEEFLRHVIIGVLNDYSRGLFLVSAKYNGIIPPFYEVVLYFGFNTIHMNRFKKFCEVDNDAYQTIFSHLYLNYKNKVA